MGSEKIIKLKIQHSKTGIHLKSAKVEKKQTHYL